jgi:hypothetical protein
MSSTQDLQAGKCCGKVVATYNIIIIYNRDVFVYLHCQDTNSPVLIAEGDAERFFEYVSAY